MKLKSLIWTLGLRPKFRRYSVTAKRIHLERDGEFDFFKWQHPKDYFNSFEQQYVDDLRQFIRPGDTVVDIGAHTGDSSLPLAIAAGREGCVLAVEPNPFVFEVLEQNSTLNQHRCNIIPINFAAGDSEGEAIFHYSDPGCCNGGEMQGLSRWVHGHPFELTVKTTNVEFWMQKFVPERIEKVSFIKVDTEGNDLRVLESLANTIEKCRPTIHAEMYRHLDLAQREALWDFLTLRGYRLFINEECYGCRTDRPLMRTKLASIEHYDILAIQ